jgi:rubrerythrin
MPREAHQGEVVTGYWLKLLEKVCQFCGHRHYQYSQCPICKMSDHPTREQFSREVDKIAERLK